MKIKVEKNPTLLVVAAALVRDDGEILVQQRSAHRSMPGLWEFPGGKVEPTETPEAALRRELAEELGIGVAETALVPAAFASEPLGDRHLLLLLYLCRSWTGTPRALDAAALAWRTPAQMRELSMPPADVPLVDLLDRFIAAARR